MTPEQFKEAMIELRKWFEADKEAVHSEMDQLMCQVLRNLGYGEGVEIFEQTEKWYV